MRYRSRTPLQSLPERLGDVVPPQVLVLHVDQPTGALDRLGVPTRHTSLAAPGEGVVPAGRQIGIGAQQLHHVRAVGDRRRRGQLCRQRARGRGSVAAPPPPRAPGTAVQGGRVVPALAEDRLDIVNRRSGDLGLHVVPRRRGAVLGGHVEGLRVTAVSRVVPAGVTQVDATHERHVARRIVPVTEHDQLLVVGAAMSDPHVQPCLDAVGPQPRTELLVVSLLAGHGRDRRVPHEAPYVDPAGGSATQDGQHLAALLTGELLVGVALPVGEDDDVTGTGRFDAPVQLGEVAHAIDQRPHPVALGPCLARVGGVEPGLLVAALDGCQEPLGEIASVRHSHTMARERGGGAPWRGEIAAALARHECRSRGNRRTDPTAVHSPGPDARRAPTACGRGSSW